MLVLSRKIGEKIRIGDDVVLTVVRIHGDKVRLGIDAPSDVAIHREEVHRRLHPPAAAGRDPSSTGSRADRPGSDADAPSLPAGRPGR